MIHSASAQKRFSGAYDGQIDFLLAEALRQMHFPPTLEKAESARRRFAFEELFVLQVMLAQKRGARTASAKPHRYASIAGSEAKLLQSLPFELTSDQRQAWASIKADLEREHPMVSHGRVIKDDDGTTLLDDGPRLAALREMRAIRESYRKLRGVDQPAKVEHSGGVKYEVVGVDVEDLK